MKYHTAFENQWPNFCKEIKNGSLNPKNEAELIEMIVDKINDDSQIDKTIKFQFKNNSKLFKIKRKDKFDGDTECIFTGVKILSDINNKQKLIDDCKNIISYLYDKYGDGTGVRNKLIIYDKTNTISYEDIEILEKSQKTDRVKIYPC